MALPIGSSTYGDKNVSGRKNNERHGATNIVRLRDRRRAADRREQPRRHELLRVRVDEMDVDALRARVARAVVHRELVVRVGHEAELVRRVEGRVARGPARAARDGRVGLDDARRPVAAHDQFDARGLARDAVEVRAEPAVDDAVPELRELGAEAVSENQDIKFADARERADPRVFQQHLVGPGAVRRLAPLDGHVGRVAPPRGHAVDVHGPVIRRPRCAGLGGPAAQRSQIFQGRRRIGHHSHAPLQNFALGLVESERPIDHTRALSRRDLRRRHDKAAGGHKSHGHRPRIVLLVIIAAPS